MENAKHSAQIRQIQVHNDQQDDRLDGHDTRLDTVENDIDNIADHAWKTLMHCGIGGGPSGAGYKITWNPAGSGSWGCVQETDPTVKTFAKTDLPTCGAGQVLRADGTKLICTTSAGSSGFEVDPYVQDFARNTDYTINACAATQVLTMTNKRLRCVESKDLAVTETDPNVQAFAKLALPACAAGQVLTGAINGSGVRILKCVTDTSGGFVESDPQVGSLINGRWCRAVSGRVVCDQTKPTVGTGTTACFHSGYGWYNAGETVRQWTAACTAVCHGCNPRSGTITTYKESCVSAGGRGAKLVTTVVSSQYCTRHDCGYCG